jgi:hypothetical protein
LNRLTPGSTASTIPETSQPRMNGGSPSRGKAPDRMNSSIGLTLVARIRTMTSVDPGAGAGTSVRVRTSGPPKVVWVIACITSSS